MLKTECPHASALPLPPAGEGRGEGGAALKETDDTSATLDLSAHPHPALSRQRERVFESDGCRYAETVTVSRRTNSHSAALRRNPTDAERTLWFAIRDRRLGGFKIRRQVSIGPYVADFLCVEVRLVIELDGGQHTEEVDTDRTVAIRAAGYDVLRFWNNDILSNLDGVLAVLLAELTARALTLPSPKGRGF